MTAEHDVYLLAQVTLLIFLRLLRSRQCSEDYLFMQYSDINKTIDKRDGALECFRHGRLKRKLIIVPSLNSPKPIFEFENCNNLVHVASVMQMFFVARANCEITASIYEFHGLLTASYRLEKINKDLITLPHRYSHLLRLDKYYSFRCGTTFTNAALYQD